MSIKYDRLTLELMSIFEAITRSKLKDHFEMGETMVFIVLPGQLRKALGPKTINVQKLRNKLNKKIKIVVGLFLDVRISSKLLFFRKV